jgi:environmental stress-induced protein Ves
MLAPAEVDATPWRNGAGRTRELVDVPGRWRLSVAEVRADAPFSAYPGLDRVFLPMVDVVLVVDGIRRSVPRGTPTVFPGEASVTLELVADGGSAVNLMTVRERCTGTLRAWSWAEWSRAEWDGAGHDASSVFVDLDQVIVEAQVTPRPSHDD